MRSLKKLATRSCSPMITENINHVSSWLNEKPNNLSLKPQNKDI